TNHGATPVNGTIFDRLDAHHISWANYYQQLPTALLVPDLEAHRPIHHLRRARGLLRPRPTAASDQARLDSATARSGRSPRRVRPLRLPRPPDRGLPVGACEVRLARGPGPYLSPGVHRAQVEP